MNRRQKSWLMKTNLSRRVYLCCKVPRYNPASPFQSYAKLELKTTPTPYNNKELYDQKVAESKAVTVRMYPDITIEDSDLVKLVEKVDRYWQQIDHPLYDDPSKPLILVEMCALRLNIKPVLD